MSRIIAGSQMRLEISGQSDIGECRRTAKRLAEAARFEEAAVGKICISATELATNVVRHGGGGEMLLQVLDDGILAELELLAIDRGPGMKDVGQCLQDGYSTGGTPGTGLGAVSRLSSTFDLFSAPGQGTVVLSRTARQPGAAWSSPPAAAWSLEFGAVCIALAGEIECGDTWRIADDGARVGMLIADGLGHGPLAATAARAAAKAFGERPFDEPSALMNSLHQALSGGRGAAAACARLRAADLQVDYAGVGNICGTVATRERSRGMVSHNGTLGVQLLRSQQFEYEWALDSRVVMHSDGVSARWALAAYPGLFGRHPAVVAGVLYRDFSRKRDDATVLVASRKQ
ncbi:MAG TPA: SpoIIE family protein phosphatase [Steroidobacteraceae bacterium]|nr:SpoIIE family protein phosphatase [Steroidobacteraceae bacterium]